MGRNLEIAAPFLDGASLVIDSISRCGFAGSGYYKVAWHLCDGRRSTPSFNSSVETPGELVEKVSLSVSGVKNVNFAPNGEKALTEAIADIMGSER